MGLTGSKNINNNSDTINWNNIKTENMSSSVHPISYELSNEAHELISNLNIPSLSEINTSEYSFNNNNFIDNPIFSKISNKNIDKYLNSTTSDFDNIFINSDYKNNFQSGGSKKEKKDVKHKEKNVKHKEKDDDDKEKEEKDDDDNDDDDDDEIDDTSSSSITSSSSSSSSSSNKKKDCSCNKSDKLSYLSSSAHTGGDFSDTQKSSSSGTDGSEKSSESKELSSEKSSTVSKNPPTAYGNKPMINENNVSDKSSILNENDSVTTMSVNTSDINLINNY
jgi:hypothetical protein